jgi:hypothetical protein
MKAHFDDVNIISEHGTWAVTYQGIAALDYAMFFESDRLEGLDDGAVSHLGYVNLDDFNAALQAGLSYHGTIEEREEERLAEYEEEVEEREEHGKLASPATDEEEQAREDALDNSNEDVVDSESGDDPVAQPGDEDEKQSVNFDGDEGENHKPFNQMTKAELNAYADDNGIDVPDNASKAEVREAVENA